jgi:hypothetical protein
MNEAQGWRHFGGWSPLARRPVGLNMEARQARIKIRRVRVGLGPVGPRTGEPNLRALTAVYKKIILINPA